MDAVLKICTARYNETDTWIEIIFESLVRFEIQYTNPL